MSEIGEVALLAYAREKGARGESMPWAELDPLLGACWNERVSLALAEDAWTEANDG